MSLSENDLKCIKSEMDCGRQLVVVSNAMDNNEKKSKSESEA